MLQLGNHIRIHPPRYFRILHPFVGRREIKIRFNRMTSVQQSLLIVVFHRRYRQVKLTVNFFWDRVRKRIKRLRILLHRVKLFKFVTYSQQFRIYLGHRLHVHIQLHSELLAENINQFHCRSRRAARKIPDNRVHNVRPVHNSRQHRPQSKSGRTVRMEVNGYVKFFFKERNQPRNARGRYQSTHILYGNHVGAQSQHFLRLVQKIFVCKNWRMHGFLFFLLGKQVEQPALFTLLRRLVVILRVYGITNGAIRHSSIFLDGGHTRFNIVHIVQSIKNTHDIQTRGNGIPEEAINNLIGIRSVAI